ncbi:MAG: response regulator [Elusimicrobia bacterium]|nr:response regulator [Elusimicrobiota bacterium]
MKRILVVDDDPDFRRMIARTLEKHGMIAVAAGTTTETRAAVTLEEIDAVLLDIVLGKENGWEILRQLRGLSDVPILLMTGAEVDAGMRLDAEKLGAQGVLQKPLEAVRLIKEIEKIFQR